MPRTFVFVNLMRNALLGAFFFLPASNLLLNKTVSAMEIAVLLILCKACCAGIVD